MLILLDSAPPAGYQRMRIGRIVDFLFGRLPRAERETKRRSVHNWVRGHRLRAKKVDGVRGVYDVEIQSLTLLKSTIHP
jgi:hypothetical protein